MFCPQCGKEIEESSKFCRFCGSSVVYGPDLPLASDVLPQDTDSPRAVIQGEDVQPSPSFEGNTQPQESNVPQKSPSGDSSKKKRNVIIGTIGLIAVILVGAVAYAGSNDNTDVNKHKFSSTPTEDDYIMLENLEHYSEGVKGMPLFELRDTDNGSWPKAPNDNFCKAFYDVYKDRQVCFFGFNLSSKISGDTFIDSAHKIVIEDDIYADFYEDFTNEEMILVGTVVKPNTDGTIQIKVDYLSSAERNVYVDPALQREVNGKPARVPRLPGDGEVTIDFVMNYGINFTAYAHPNSPEDIPTFYKQNWPKHLTAEHYKAFVHQLGGEYVRFVGVKLDKLLGDYYYESTDMGIKYDSSHPWMWYDEDEAKYYLGKTCLIEAEVLASYPNEIFLGYNYDDDGSYPTASPEPWYEYWADPSYLMQGDFSHWWEDYTYIDIGEYDSNHARVLSYFREGDQVYIHGSLGTIYDDNVTVYGSGLTLGYIDCYFDANSILYNGLYNLNRNDEVYVYGNFHANSWGNLVLRNCEFYTEKPQPVDPASFLPDDDPYNDSVLYSFNLS